MVLRSKGNNIPFVLLTGLLAWLLPGAGYFCLNQKKRAIIIFVTITLTFCFGLYIGSVGVIDPVRAKAWYVAQIFNSPLVAIVGYTSAGGGYPVYGRPAEIGQIYTSISGLLNLLCIINTIYLAYLYRTEAGGEHNVPNS